MSASSTAFTVQGPKLSASVVIVNSQNEILLVQRTPESRAYGGVTVFPGGNFDVGQDRSLEITAIRETFEETGILLVERGHALDTDIIDDARRAIHSQRVRFPDFVAQHGLQPDIGSLLPCTQWITPLDAPRRFRTQFYLLFLRPELTSSSSGVRQEPTSDGGVEVVSTHFVHPTVALQYCRQGKFTFMPPQFYIITTLAGILRGSQTTREQRAQIEALSRGEFGRMVINPVRLTDPDSDGSVIFAYEGDEARGGPKGRRHRAVVPVKNNKFVTRGIRLERNFDIFSEIERPALSVVSKL